MGMWKPCSREVASGLALPTPAQTLCRLKTSGPPALGPSFFNLGLQGLLLLSLEAVRSCLSLVVRVATRPHPTQTSVVDSTLLR